MLAPLRRSASEGSGNRSCPRQHPSYRFLLHRDMSSRTSKHISIPMFPTSVSNGFTISIPFSTLLLSFSTGPPGISTSNRCNFWYRCVISPSASIQTSVFFTFLPSCAGSWIPTLMGRRCSRAKDFRPSTKGLVVVGRASEMVSGERGAM